jgi:hypothetical protein
MHGLCIKQYCQVFIPCQTWTGTPERAPGMGHRRRAPLRPGLGAVPAFGSSLPSDITTGPKPLSQLISGCTFSVCTGKLAQVPLHFLATSLTGNKRHRKERGNARQKCKNPMFILAMPFSFLCVIPSNQKWTIAHISKTSNDLTTRFSNRALTGIKCECTRS